MVKVEDDAFSTPADRAVFENTGDAPPVTLPLIVMLAEAAVMYAPALIPDVFVPPTTEPVWFQTPLPDTNTPPAMPFPTTLEGPVIVPIVLSVPTPVRAATPKFVAV